MTINYSKVLTDIKSGSKAAIRQYFETITTSEVVELATFLGPERLYQVVAAPILVPTVLRPPGSTTWDIANLLAQVSAQAFNKAIAFARAINPDPAMIRDVTSALLDVGHRRRAAPLLTMNEDVTNTLPTPSGAPASLSDADFTAAATRNNVAVEAIKAVAMVESSGAGFDAQGRPKILFEAHHFGPLTRHLYDKTHPHLSCHTTDEARVFYGRSWDQYERLREAMVLDVNPALEAASWGKFQVLGQNHNGWPDARSFVAAMYQSEANHLRAFEAYCNANRLFDAVRRKDWSAFAAGYNGPRQQGYDTRIADTYRALGGT